MIRGLFVAALASMAAAGDDNVLVLKDSTFDKAIKDNNLILVEFYAPWCGHCKKLAPEYSKAADQLVDTEAKLAMVDATEEKNVGEEYEIKGFPTLKLFRNGKVSDYEGGRTAADIVKYMKSFIGPAVKEVGDQDALDTLVKENSVVVALFADAESDEAAANTFAKIADDHRTEYTFVSAPAALGSKHCKDGQKLVVLKTFDDLAAAYSGDIEEEPVMAFIGAESLPLLAEVGPENYSKYMARGLPFAWLFINPDEKDVSDAAIAEVTKVASEFKGKLSFVWLSGKQYESMVTKMALSGKKLPALAIEDDKGRHFPLDESADKVTSADVKALVQGFLDGKIEAKIKSEPKIEKNPDPEDGVWILTGNEFQAEAVDADKDVLVEFYAPWCGHCKKLKPVYAEVADYLKDTPGIRIAKMDATINDPPADIEVRGFPTIKFKKAGEKKFGEYNGGRDKDAFLGFLKKNARTEFDFDA